MQSMLEFMLISFTASEFVFDLLPAVSYGTGMEWGWNWMLCGDGSESGWDGWGWNQSLWGWVWFLSPRKVS